uniref:Uncharacterized protein n=1 Tax=Oryza meridionalis TaxID=40149 RepID=A0A0E0F3J0_9ORYZ
MSHCRPPSRRHRSPPHERRMALDPG